MAKYALSEIGVANRIEEAVKAVLKKGYRTKDLANYGAKVVCSTSEMGAVIAKEIEK